MADKTPDEFKRLLLAMADEFESLTSPFTGDFLGRHEVTMNDCAQASEVIAYLLRAYVLSPQWAQTAMMMVGTSHKLVPPEMAWTQILGQEAQKKLRAMNTGRK